MFGSDGDIRVLEANQDATMEEVGDKGRPPESGSWLQKVVGSNGGGIPVPEDVLDDEFISTRLHLGFPDGEDGDPVITIGDEVLDAMNGLWKKCMIVKVLGRNVSIPVLSRRLRELWKPQGTMVVMDLPRQYFFIRFEVEEEYMAALRGGPWKVFGSYLTVQDWSPVFDPVRDEIKTTPVWVRFANIPVNFYHKSILMGIAKGLGKPLKVDLTTSKLERARFARVCVEVNLKKPLKGTVLINGQRYYVSYEGLTNICSGCGLYGHLIHNCPKVSKEKRTVEMSQNIAVQNVTSSSVPVNDGFVRVRPRGGRPVSHRNGQLDGGDGERGKSVAHMRNPRSKNMAIVPIANSFERLDVDLGNGENQELDKELDKENRNNPNITDSVKRVDQVTRMVFGAESGKGVKGKQNGSLVKRNGLPEAHERIKNKQSRISRPTPGYIFGPPGEVVELSSSGKRLRTEGKVVERTGRGGLSERGSGQVSSRAEIQRVEEQPMQISVEGELPNLNGSDTRLLVEEGGEARSA